MERVRVQFRDALAGISVTNVVVRNATISDVCRKWNDLCIEQHAEKRGIRMHPEGGISNTNRVTIVRDTMSLWEMLDEICKQGGVTWSVGQGFVRIANEETEANNTRVSAPTQGKMTDFFCGQAWGVPFWEGVRPALG
jgi:hypothetical protein